MANNQPIKIPKFSKPDTSSRAPKLFSPSDAKIYNAGQRGVTGKPFSPAWTNQVDNNIAKVMSGEGYKNGGKVKKTGKALVHKGEVVIPKKIVKEKTYSQVAKSVRKTMGKK